MKKLNPAWTTDDPKITYQFLEGQWWLVNKSNMTRMGLSDRLANLKGLNDDLSKDWLLIMNKQRKENEKRLKKEDQKKMVIPKLPDRLPGMPEIKEQKKQEPEKMVIPPPPSSPVIKEYLRTPTFVQKVIVEEHEEIGGYTDVRYLNDGVSVEFKFADGWIAVKAKNPFLEMGGTETGIRLSQVNKYFKTKKVKK